MVFFVDVKANIAHLLNKGVITNPKAIQVGEEFIDYVANRDFSKLSTQEDIDRVNGILDYLINVIVIKLF
ncbi:hypothetical protein MNBD_CPR01-22 [hydrothermal vent metagenome]|uniref:Uncharacterized protein n=1 Tax=hydrothermal vent metagenome TaxID=652676 RepID=A0A3B0VIF3_9ZZZZ